MNWCENNGLGFTITADQDAGVKGVIPAVRDWKPLLDADGKKTDREVEVGTDIHMMTRAQEPFCLVVQRRRDPQLPLFEPNGYRYYVIATNRDDLSPEEVVWFHNQRGHAETFIKELKVGFGMEQMTSGDFRANGLWFAVGVLAYNLTQAQKLLFMDPEWKPKTVATLRRQLVETAGRLVRHGRRLILRIAASWEKLRLFLRIREGCAAFS